MALVSSIKLSDEEKLDILQRLDRFQQWRSLDEKRIASFTAKSSLGGKSSNWKYTWKLAAAHHLPDGTLGFDADGMGAANR